MFNLVHLVRLKTVKCFQRGLSNWKPSMWEAISPSLKAWMGAGGASSVSTLSLLSGCYDAIHSVPPCPPLASSLDVYCELKVAAKRVRVGIVLK